MAYVIKFCFIMSPLGSMADVADNSPDEKSHARYSIVFFLVLYVLLKDAIECAPHEYCFFTGKHTWHTISINSKTSFFSFDYS